MVTILLSIGILITDGKKCTFDQVESYLLNFATREAQFSYVRKRFESLQDSHFNSSMNKIIVVGDSFAMDFLNMTMKNNRQIHIGNEDRNRFIPEIMKKECAFKENNITYALPLIERANIVIFASKWLIWNAQRLATTIKILNLPRQNQTLIVISSKDFCHINPLHYLNKSITYRLKLRNSMDSACVIANEMLQKGLNDSILVNIPKMICTTNYTCPIFTSSERLISYDGEHLTREEAIYVGEVIFQNHLLTNLT
jgi:hypothetical protein